VTFLAAAGWLVGPALARQLEQLATKMPAAISLVQGAARHVPTLQSLAGGDPQVSSFVDAATGALRASVKGVFAALMGIAMGVYGAFDPGVYSRSIVKLVPQAKRARVRAALERATASLLQWMLGRVVTMVVVGVVTGVGLSLAGIPLALLLGVVAGLASFIPYLGVLVSILPALLVAITKDPLSMVWVVVVFVIAHAIEGWILAPLMARRFKFPPAFTMAAQLVLGPVWGWLGFTFAMPVAILAAVLVRALYVEDTLGDRTPV
jgi:predicted PurR-regulated permease PerM